MDATSSRGADSSQAEVDELGPLLLEQHATHGIAIVYLLCGGLVLAFGLVCMAVPWAAAPPAMFSTGLALAVSGACVLAAGAWRVWSWRASGLFLHERGIRQQRAGRTSILQFADVAEMRYQSTRIFVNGSYGGTVEHLGVRAAGDGPWLFFQRRKQEKTGLATGYTEASEVDRAARAVCALLVPRWSQQLAAGQRLPWTTRMRLAQDGVELSRTRWYECELADLFRRQPRWEFFTWDQIERTQINQGVLYIWIKGQSTPRQRVLVGEVNFQPGYTLFAAALARSEPAPARNVAADLSAANRAENLTVRFAWTAADHIARQEHWDRRTPTGRKDWRIRTWVPTGIAAGFGLLFSIIARIFHRVTTPVFLLLLAGIGLAACLLAGLLSLGFRWGQRRRIRQEIAHAHQLALAGKAIDPLTQFELTLGPAGYVVRSGGRERRVSWQQIARVEHAAGYVFLHAAGSKLALESIEMMIPPRAFAHENDALAAAERIRDWHARSQGDPAAAAR